MKLLAILMLIFTVALVSGFPRSHRKNEYERRRVVYHKSVRKEHKHDAKHEGSKSKHHTSSKKGAHKLFKKFGMIAAPGFALEDSAVAQNQEQPALQQVLVPVNAASFTQASAAAPEMVSSFAAAPTQRATLGTEVSQMWTTCNPLIIRKKRLLRNVIS